MDHSVAEELRVVHGCAEGRGEEGRDRRVGDAHLHHPVLPQVRPEDHYAGELE